MLSFEIDINPQVAEDKCYTAWITVIYTIQLKCRKKNWFTAQLVIILWGNYWPYLIFKIALDLNPIFKATQFENGALWTKKKLLKLLFERELDHQNSNIFSTHAKSLEFKVLCNNTFTSQDELHCFMKCNVKLTICGHYLFEWNKI